MRLYELMVKHRVAILMRCRTKASSFLDVKCSEALLVVGLPALYDQILEHLKGAAHSHAVDLHACQHPAEIDEAMIRRTARESCRLGCTVSQVIHGYGAFCHGIAEFLQETSFGIRVEEFCRLSLCFDVAIAHTASEYEVLSREQTEETACLRLGTLLHDIRNYLANAMMAHELLRHRGAVATVAASSVVAIAHQQIKSILDRVMIEVRLSHEPEVELVCLPLFGLISQVESAALPEAKAKGIQIHIDIDRLIEVWSDRHLLTSALANLLQNAIKFTHPEGNVWIRAFGEGDEVVIEVEDRCGGLPPGAEDELFKPRVQRGIDRSGLGLGLSIAKRAVELHYGALECRSLPETGCVFTVRLPRNPGELMLATARTNAVQNTNSQIDGGR